MRFCIAWWCELILSYHGVLAVLPGAFSSLLMGEIVLLGGLVTVMVRGLGEVVLGLGFILFPFRVVWWVGQLGDLGRVGVVLFLWGVASVCVYLSCQSVRWVWQGGDSSVGVPFHLLGHRLFQGGGLVFLGVGLAPTQPCGQGSGFWGLPDVDRVSRLLGLGLHTCSGVWVVPLLGSHSW